MTIHHHLLLQTMVLHHLRHHLHLWAVENDHLVVIAPCHHVVVLLLRVADTMTTDAHTVMMTGTTEIDTIILVAITTTETIATTGTATTETVMTTETDTIDMITAMSTETAMSVTTTEEEDILLKQEQEDLLNEEQNRIERHQLLFTQETFPTISLNET